MRRDYNFYVYILASTRKGTLYIGVTNDLFRRVLEHKRGLVKSFTKKYKVHRLVYYEHHQYIDNAIAREKFLKGKTRRKKIALIEDMNPDWKDLSDDWYGGLSR